MKLRTLLCSLLTLVLAASPLQAAGKRDSLWKEVNDAMAANLPQTAAAKLALIVKAATGDKAWPEAIKAVALCIVNESQIEGGDAGEKITRLEAEIVKAPKEMTPVLEAILAEWYWEYFQENRSRFMQRTRVSGETEQAPPLPPVPEVPEKGVMVAAPPAAKPKDFTTWDLPRLYSEIDAHFTKALAAEADLKKIPIADFDALLTKGTVPDTWRPTLYDFLAHEALEFYSSGEQAATKAVEEFEVEASGPIFGTMDEFLKWEPAGDSIKVKAIRMFQALMRYHADDADKSALLHCDLERLRFGKNHATGDEKEAKHAAALKRFAEQWADQEMAASARFAWAQALGASEPLQARDVAKQGADAFPKSIGGQLCRTLVKQIEATARVLSIRTERVWNAPWPAISVRYCNLTTLHFRLVKLDWAEELKRAEDQSLEKRLPGMKPERTWKVRLPATPDFRERVEEIPSPTDLKPGLYALIASPAEDFGEENNVISYTEVWVSELALVLRERHGETRLDGFVLHARSGEPIEGAHVHFRVEDGGWLSPKPSAKTDRNGYFSVKLPNEKQMLGLATYQDQQLAIGDSFYLSREQRERDIESQTIFFTDRSLYRPGQTIQYKGICLRADREKDNYKVLGGQAVTVEFLDVNGKEIAKAQHKANDYGSFSSNFTAPRDRVAGTMSIRVKKGPDGMTRFNVEEYKRPKFHVTLDAPKDAAKLGEKVTIHGKAIAYNGTAVANGNVAWRIVRNVRLPGWWSSANWWRNPVDCDEQEIAYGKVVSKDDGSFEFTFSAKPDPSVSDKDEPVFTFSIHADVTDTSGETRSTQRDISVGYAALTATLDVDEWLPSSKKIELRISTQSLDGEGRSAEGTVKIHKLKQPAKVVREPLENDDENWSLRRPIVTDTTPKPDPANPDSWEPGEVVHESNFTSDGAGKARLSFNLAPGPYRATLETKDAFGKKVTAPLRFNVLNVDGKPLATRIPNLVAGPSWELKPGSEFVALWATGYERARAFIEIEHRGKMLQAFWTEPGLSQQQVTQAVTEAHRGGFTLHVTMVRENRAYLTSEEVEVPWDNKELNVKWEHFTSKLEPSQKEKWTAVITGPDAKKASAEMMAALYDQSLDAFLPHRWISAFNVFRQHESSLSMRFENELQLFDHLAGSLPEIVLPEIRFRDFPEGVGTGDWEVRGDVAKSVFEAVPAPRNRSMRAYSLFTAGATSRSRPALDPNDFVFKSNPVTAGNRSGSLAISANAVDALLFGVGGQSKLSPGVFSFAGAGTDPAFQVTTRSLDGRSNIDLASISARKNLNETAFFFPQLLVREDGSVAMEFTMPEALTTWRFMGFAHDKELRSGFLEDKVVTAKDLMVQPNPPRFLREGDLLEFTAKVSNQSATRQAGKVRLSLADARTRKAADAAFANPTTDQEFDLPSHESRSFSWKLKVPDGAEPVSYKVVGSTERLSDGEDGLLPVLSRRTLVTESLPLPIRDARTKNFEFKRLMESGKSETLKSQTLTVQMVSNPSWYAVLALPYLMEFPHECTEQTFSRLYANALARHIAKSDPKIRTIFDQWKATPALDSPLEKNADLKSVVLDETPWVRDAQAESQSRRNVGVLFDDNRLDSETARLLRKLAEQQLGDGAWPWFPGGRGSDYITLYITTGFGRLRHLGVKIDTGSALKSLARLDAWIDREYREIKAKDRGANHLSSTIALYLYGRSFFLAEKPIAATHKDAVDYWLGQARKYWLELGGRQSEGHAALALKRFGDKASAQAILKSLRERSVNNEEMGMFWRDKERSWEWQRAPIETQALMIEAFDEVANDQKAVEDCKVWLLKQKQTQDWKTTKATADAIYALLLRGGKVLASDALVELSLGGEPIKPEKVEAGTGFYEQKFVRGEVKPELGKITLKKTDKGVAWGGVHWQYLEDMSKVTAYDGTPLKLTKELYTRQLTDKGPVLVPLKGAAKIGDELVVRIIVRVDRDMEFVHLKDHRGSGTEPVNVLSQYKWQDGLGYYETTRDTASHFFFDALPKGNYVFEYSTRIVHRGRYQTGFANIQCMYAPEFGGHSESLWVDAE